VDENESHSDGLGERRYKPPSHLLPSIKINRRPQLDDPERLFYEEFRKQKPRQLSPVQLRVLATFYLLFASSMGALFYRMVHDGGATGILVSVVIVAVTMGLFFLALMRSIR
jgi:hypothetical protein